MRLQEWTHHWRRWDLGTRRQEQFCSASALLRGFIGLSETMKTQKVFATTARFVGASAIGLGIAVAALLCSPLRETGSTGLHREKYDGEQMLVYGQGYSFYMTSTRVVATTAVVFTLLGCAFLFFGRTCKATGSSDRGAITKDNR
jgi:hypothetical protein